MDINTQVEKAAKAILQADAIFISAGAGMGVDSGLPDFRGNEGFWKAYPLLKHENLSFSDLANPIWFDDDPLRAWGFYGHRFLLYKQTETHKGFQLLQKWCKEKNIQPFVFTSNVDGHFQKAGFDPDSIYECHGSINHLQCSALCSSNIWPVEHIEVAIDESNLTAEGNLPRCPRCSAIARPNILMFGDGEWISKRSAAQSRRFAAWQAQQKGKKIVTIEMGAGKAIPTVRYASEDMPGTLVRINPRDSDGPSNTISIACGALEAPEKIDHILNE